MPRPKRTWTAEEDAWLGVISDGEVARRIGCSVSSVFLRRKELQIHVMPTERRGHVKLAQEQVDEILARWRERGHHRKGPRVDGDRSITARELATEYGVSEATISAIVTRRNRVRRSDEALPILMRRYDWSAVEDRLGKEPDAAIARAMECTTMAVRRQRLKLGIPPFCGPGRRPR